MGNFGNMLSMTGAMLLLQMHINISLTCAVRNTNLQGNGGEKSDSNSFAPKNAEVEKLLDELDSDVIGMESVKKEVRNFYTMVRVQQQKQAMGLPGAEGQSLHMAFLGNPGTGKTMVARIVGKILVAMGALKPKGNYKRGGENVVYEVGRADLVGQYVGQTAPKVKDAIKNADGGVLFIDEAYSLKQEGVDDSYGQEAVDTLIAEMENNRGHVVVVLAGYKDQMQKFIATNKGFESRVPFHFEFDDYSCPDLVKIAQIFLKNAKVDLGGDCSGTSPPAACDWLKIGAKLTTNCCEDNTKCPNLNKYDMNGNGRTIRNLLEASYRHMAGRTLSTFSPNTLNGFYQQWNHVLGNEKCGSDAPFEKLREHPGTEIRYETEAQVMTAAGVNSISDVDLRCAFKVLEPSDITSVIVDKARSHMRDMCGMAAAEWKIDRSVVLKRSFEDFATISAVAFAVKGRSSKAAKPRQTDCSSVVSALGLKSSKPASQLETQVEIQLDNDGTHFLNVTDFTTRFELSNRRSGAKTAVCKDSCYNTRGEIYGCSKSCSSCPECATDYRPEVPVINCYSNCKPVSDPYAHLACEDNKGLVSKSCGACEQCTEYFKDRPSAVDRFLQKYKTRELVFGHIARQLPIPGTADTYVPPREPPRDSPQDRSGSGSTKQGGDNKPKPPNFNPPRPGAQAVTDELTRASTSTKADKLMEELNEMIGLDAVKRNMVNIRDQVEFDMWRKRFFGSDAALGGQSYHMQFLGNPGTGKTVVARIVGELLAELEVICPSKEGCGNGRNRNRGQQKINFVEATRADLVAGYVGQTAPKVKELMKKADGGVLFIDEAYSLVQSTSGHQKDQFGLEAVDTLIAEMENNRKHIIVIMAGYEVPMQEFFRSNAGLASRVPFSFHFEDYKCNELAEIGEMRFKREQMTLAGAGAKTWFSRLVQASTGCCDNDQCPPPRDPGNGRTVRNLVDASVREASTRAVKAFDQKKEPWMQAANGDGVSALKSLNVKCPEKGDGGLDACKYFMNIEKRDVLKVAKDRVSKWIRPFCLEQANHAKLQGSEPIIPVQHLTRYLDEMSEVVGSMTTDNWEQFNKALGDQNGPCKAALDVLKSIEHVPSNEDVDAEEGTATQEETIPEPEPVEVDPLEKWLGWWSYDRSEYEITQESDSSLRFRERDGSYDMVGVLQLSDGGWYEGELRSRSRYGGQGTLHGSIKAKLNTDTDKMETAFKEPRATSYESILKASRKPKVDRPNSPYGDRYTPNAPATKAPSVGQKEKIDGLFKKLDGFVGLANVKKEVRKLYTTVLFNLYRDTIGLKGLSGQSYHMQFLGNPGTGKTTIARIVGELMREMGVVKDNGNRVTGKVKKPKKDPSQISVTKCHRSQEHAIGQCAVALGIINEDDDEEEEKNPLPDTICPPCVREVGRGDLVGQYVGKTAQLVKDQVARVLGGTLFIDEAYSLKQVGEDTFGQEAVDTLIAEMENHRDELIVILAGYEADMDRFIESNPGFKSRVPFVFHFEDYSCEQMVQMGEIFIKSQQMSPLDEATKKLFGPVLQFESGCCYAAEDGCEPSASDSNGRDVRNVVERMIRTQNARLDLNSELTKADYQHFTVADVADVLHDLVSRQVVPICKEEVGQLAMVTGMVQGSKYNRNYGPAEDYSTRLQSGLDIVKRLQAAVQMVGNGYDFLGSQATLCEANVEALQVALTGRVQELCGTEGAKLQSAVKVLQDHTKKYAAAVGKGEPTRIIAASVTVAKMRAQKEAQDSKWLLDLIPISMEAILHITREERNLCNKALTDLNSVEMLSKVYA